MKTWKQKEREGDQTQFLRAKKLEASMPTVTIRIDARTEILVRKDKFDRLGREECIRLIKQKWEASRKLSYMN